MTDLAPVRSQLSSAAIRRRAITRWSGPGWLWLLLLGIIVVASLIAEPFLSSRNLTNVLRQMIPLGIVAVGQTLVILLAGVEPTGETCANNLRVVIASTYALAALASSPLALSRLGYSDAEVDQINAYITENATIVGAPGLRELRLHARVVHDAHEDTMLRRDRSRNAFTVA